MKLAHAGLDLAEGVEMIERGVGDNRVEGGRLERQAPYVGDFGVQAGVARRGGIDDRGRNIDASDYSRASGQARRPRRTSRS